MPSNQEKAYQEAEKAIKTYDTMLAVCDILKNMVEDHKQHAQKFINSRENPEENVQLNSDKNGLQAKKKK